jgi:hypothetical protein
LYFLDEEMRRRNAVLPIKDITPPTNKTKQARILSLVPRFEWSRIFLNRGQADLEIELMQFPRGSHDDLIDALASIEYIYSAPSRPTISQMPNMHTKEYEAEYIKRLKQGRPYEKNEDDI